MSEILLSGNLGSITIKVLLCINFSGDYIPHNNFIVPIIIVLTLYYCDELYPFPRSSRISELRPAGFFSRSQAKSWERGKRVRKPHGAGAGRRWNAHACAIARTCPLYACAYVRTPHLARVHPVLISNWLSACLLSNREHAPLAYCS